jgi:DNA binding domain, excisionase family
MTKSNGPVADVRTNPPHNMKLAEAAAYVGVSSRTLWTLIRRRELRASRVGKRLILTRTELDRFLALSAVANG